MTDEKIDIKTIGKDLAEIIVQAKFAKSKTEARKFIKQGAIRINDDVVKDPFARLAEVEGKILLLQNAH